MQWLIFVNIMRVLSMKKILLIVFVLCIGVSLSAQENKILKNKVIYPGDVKAKAILLMDMDTKNILYGKKIYSALPNASTTKLLTAVVACEKLCPDDIMTVTENAAKTPYNSIEFKVGETISMEDCLGAMLIRSANDASVVIAENVAGSTEKFAEMMNEKAADLGCLNTNFVTPSGIHDPRHYSTCYDLVLIGMAAKKTDLINKYINLLGFEITTRSDPKGITKIKSTNRYVLEYPYSTGAKSGYSTPAGNTIVATASKNGKNLILVILNTDNVYDTACGIMNWGFKNPNKHIIEYK